MTADNRTRRVAWTLETALDPQPGYFKMQVAKGGAWLPALIYRPCPIHFDEPDNLFLDRSHPLYATIDDHWANPLWVWERGQPVGEREYLQLLINRRRVRDNPAHPEFDPKQPVDISRLPTPF